VSSPSRRSMLHSPSLPDSRGGARRHPHAGIDVHGNAAERPQDFLRALKNEVLLIEQTNGNNSTNLSTESDQGHRLVHAVLDRRLQFQYEALIVPPLPMHIDPDADGAVRDHR